MTRIPDLTCAQIADKLIAVRRLLREADAILLEPCGLNDQDQRRLHQLAVDVSTLSMESEDLLLTVARPEPEDETESVDNQKPARRECPCVHSGSNFEKATCGRCGGSGWLPEGA